MSIDSNGGGLRKRRRPFTNIPSSTIRDPDISAKALGILVISLDKPEGWVFRADAIARERNRDGRDSIASGYRELAERGYYRVERRRMLDGTFAMGNAISEDPVAEWAREYEEYEGKPIPLIQQPDGTFLVKRKDGTLVADGFEDEFSQVTPVTGFPEPDDPDSVNPHTGRPGLGEPGALSNKENSPKKLNTDQPPGGVGSLRSPTPPGGARERARRPREAPSGRDTSAGAEPLFDVADEHPTGNDLVQAGGVPGPRSGQGGSGRGGAGRAAGRGSVLPDDFWPDEVTWKRAVKECPSLTPERLKLEVTRAILNSQSRGAAYKDHNKYWLNWVLRTEADVQGYAQRQVSGGYRPYRNEETWGEGSGGAESWQQANTLPVDPEAPAPLLEDVLAYTRRETEELARRERAEAERRRNPWTS